VKEFDDFKKEIKPGAGSLLRLLLKPILLTSPTIYASPMMELS
jgi:hypothetical protein